MRINLKTIKLSKVRRLIREAIVWYDVDNGMPHFYTSDNWQRSRKCKIPVKGEFPYYTKSDKAIESIAKKIYELVKE